MQVSKVTTRIDGLVIRVLKGKSFKKDLQMQSEKCKWDYSLMLWFRRIFGIENDF